MDQAALGQLHERFDRMVRERLPGAPIERVAVLQYGDDPEIEPGQVLGRVYLAAGPDQDARQQAMEDFHHAYRAPMRDLRHDLDGLPGIGLLEIVPAGEGEDCADRGPRMRLQTRGAMPAGAEGPTVPVMARLGPADLETVDVLITAGIAANRADAVRWALARIRERPAYAQLQQRAREIEDLKTQF